MGITGTKRQAESVLPPGTRVKYFIINPTCPTVSVSSILVASRSHSPTPAEENIKYENQTIAAKTRLTKEKQARADVHSVHEEKQNLDTDAGSER